MEARGWFGLLLITAGMFVGAAAQDVPDRLGMDTSAKPGDGFYTYANGRWLRDTALPPDHAEVGALQLAVDGIDERVRRLLEDSARAPEGSSAAKVSLYYRTFVDSKTRDHMGISPVRPLLDAIESASNRRVLASLMGREQVDFTASLADVYVDIDHHGRAAYAFFLTQSGLGLPDRDYYLEPAFQPQRTAYRDYLSGLLAAAGVDDSGTAARDVILFESLLAHVSWSDDRQTPASERRMSLVQLSRFAPGFDWSAFSDGANLPPDATVVVAEPGAARALARVFAQTPLPVLRHWMMARVMDRAAPFLSTRIVAAWQRFHEQAIGGQAANMPEWRRAVRLVGGTACVGDGAPSSDCFGSLRWAVGDLYLAKYFTDDVHGAAQRMIDALRVAFRSRLASEPWMTPATRAAAVEKLDAYTIKLGGPAKPEDLSTLTLRKGDVVGNARAAATLAWARQRARVGRPVDPSAWVESPQTVDANNGSALDVEFPAGLFQDPVFDPMRDPAYNFGALGAFIGHEWTHGFDNTGRYIDAGNRRRDWWAPADAKAFNQRATMLARQYDSFSPLPNMHVRGFQTLDEDIADLGGLSVALDAYHASLKGTSAPVVDGFTGDQRVFLGWAWLWRGKKSAAALKKQIVDDVHAPFQVRVDGVVQNMDDWYKSFGVRPGCHLYLAPGHRVRLW